MRPIFCVCVMFFIKSKSEKIITYNSLCIILRNLAKIIILKNMKIWHWHGMDHAQLVTIEYSEFGIYLHISNIGFTNDVRMTMICKKKIALHYSTKLYYNRCQCFMFFYGEPYRQNFWHCFCNEMIIFFHKWT